MLILISAALKLNFVTSWCFSMTIVYFVVIDIEHKVNLRGICCWLKFVCCLFFFFSAWFLIWEDEPSALFGGSSQDCWYNNTAGGKSNTFSNTSHTWSMSLHTRSYDLWVVYIDVVQHCTAYKKQSSLSHHELSCTREPLLPVAG